MGKLKQVVKSGAGYVTLVFEKPCKEMRPMHNFHCSVCVCRNVPAKISLDLCAKIIFQQTEDKALREVVNLTH